MWKPLKENCISRQSNWSLTQLSQQTGKCFFSKDIFSVKKVLRLNIYNYIDNPRPNSDFVFYSKLEEIELWTVEEQSSALKEFAYLHSVVH